MSTNGDRSPEPPDHDDGSAHRLADRYELTDRIGSGGAGVVWRATDTTLGREVAIKLLHHRLAGDDEAMKRFRREAMSAAALNHPNVVVIHDIGEMEEQVFLVMELVDGPTLSELLRQHGPLGPEVVAAVGRHVAAGLGAAHDRGLVHRDIKPANVLLGRDGVAKVADFGIAKALGDAQTRLTMPGTVMGTVTYLAPEQLSNVEVGAPTDVYALGLVLHELLTGETPFGEGTVPEMAAARLATDPGPPSATRDGVPPELDEVVVRATRRDPEDRYQDGRELAAALAVLTRPADHHAVTELVADTPTASQRESRTARLPAGAAASTTRALDLGATTSALGAAAPERVEGDERGSEPQRGRPAWLVPVAIIAVAAAIAVAIGLSTANDGGDPEGAPAPPQPLAIADARDFDPPPGGGEEHREDVPKAHDGDPATAWETENYSSADLGGLKPGVGIWFDLGQAASPAAVEVDLGTPGITFEVHTFDTSPPEDPGSWGEPVGRVTNAPQQARVEVPEGTQGRYWLIWITSLPGGGDAKVAEVRFPAR